MVPVSELSEPRFYSFTAVIMESRIYFRSTFGTGIHMDFYFI